MYGGAKVELVTKDELEGKLRGGDGMEKLRAGFCRGGFGGEEFSVL